MDFLEKKIESIRFVCKQIEKIDEIMSKLQDTNSIQEYQNEKKRWIQELKRLII